MLINATIRSNKTEILQNKYIELVNGGVSPDKILVLCLNSYKKQNFTDKVNREIKIPVSGKYNIQTFYGLCYNAVADNWTEIENTINFGTPEITPNLCGLELSGMFLSDCFGIDKKVFKDYFSKNNLKHQMFKRMQLIALNSLDEKQIAQKSKLLKEAFYNDATETYNKFRKQTLEHRSFDYLRQLSILPYIQEKTDYFKNIEYLLADDADEMTYSEFNFIQKLRPQLKDWIVAYDKCGASRCGYLSAYKTGVFEFEKVFNEEAKTLPTDDKIQHNTDSVYKSILEGKKTSLENFSVKSYIKRLDMIDSAFEQIDELFSKGIKPSDIVIITPIADDMLKNSFERHFGMGTRYQILSGSKKPKESRLLRNIFTVYKLIKQNQTTSFEPSEIRELFDYWCGIPLKYSKKAVNAFMENNKLSDCIFEDEIYQTSYDRFKYFIENFQSDNLKLSHTVLKMFGFLSDRYISEKELKAFNFFIKEIRSFEKAYKNIDDELAQKIIHQFENGIISENPSVAEEIDKNAIIISTPQKVIDFELKSKYQIWFDLSNDLWSMRDIGVLYNAWVFNAEWQDKEFEIDDNTELSKEKNARVIRKILMCCNKNVYAYFSQYDSSGYENIGKMQSYFITEEENGDEKGKSNKITPREDQKQVIEYTGGKGAVNAVPGAGKTTVLTALIIKLIESGVSPSKIFVLTYMESAAAHIRDKIKQALPYLTEIPNVSTIHGLAFRIIKENNNYTRLNLPDNIEVADDNTRLKILNECVTNFGVQTTKNNEEYQGGISAVKLSPNGIKPLKYLKNSIKFAEVYEAYEKKLRESGVIDYDDMLRYALELVEKHEDIRSYYQDLCQFVFEDEAQDSSELQQKFLLLLSGKYGNLLRIGDINQAITSSFTDSDPKCFKKYFEQNIKMVMKTSQRSAAPIQKLANKLIDFSKTDNLLKDTFFDSKLTPTDKNPITKINPQFKIFSHEREEKYYILGKIKKIINENPKKSIAILLRSNIQISEWAAFLSENGLTVTLRTDVLNQKTVYKVIIAFLEYLLTPFANSQVINLMNTFKECHIINFSAQDFEYIKQLKIPFINTNGDDLSECLTHLWWDLQFNDELCYAEPDEAALRIGLRYFSTQNEKSNIYLISTIIKRVSMVNSNREAIINNLKEIARRPIGSTYKFFENEKEGSVQSVRIMTMHKSKGDEFDIVYIPHLSEENFPLRADKIQDKTNFSEVVKQLRYGYKVRTQSEIKKEIAEETLRLLYVGITRAKTELYISASRLSNNKKHHTPSRLFYELGEMTND